MRILKVDGDVHAYCSDQEGAILNACGEVRIWDCRDGVDLRQLFTMECGDRKTEDLSIWDAPQISALSNDGLYFAIVDPANVIKSCYLPTAQSSSPRSFKSPGCVTVIKYGPCNQWIGGGLKDGTVRLWNLSGTPDLFDVVLHGPPYPVQLIEGHADNVQLYVLQYDQKILRYVVNIWNVCNARLIRSLKLHPRVGSTVSGIFDVHLFSGIACAPFEPKALEPDALELFDFQSGQPLGRIETASLIRKCSISKCGKWVMTVHLSGVISIWETRTGRKLRRIEASEEAADIELSASGKSLISMHYVSKLHSVVKIWLVNLIGRLSLVDAHGYRTRHNPD